MNLLIASLFTFSHFAWATPGIFGNDYHPRILGVRTLAEIHALSDLDRNLGVENSEANYDPGDLLEDLTYMNLRHVDRRELAEAVRSFGLLLARAVSRHVQRFAGAHIPEDRRSSVSVADDGMSMLTAQFEACAFETDRCPFHPLNLLRNLRDQELGPEVEEAVTGALHQLATSLTEALRHHALHDRETAKAGVAILARIETEDSLYALTSLVRTGNNQLAYQAAERLATLARQRDPVLFAGLCARILRE